MAYELAAVGAETRAPDARGYEACCYAEKGALCLSETLVLIKAVPTFLSYLNSLLRLEEGMVRAPYIGPMWRKPPHQCPIIAVVSCLRI